MAIFLSDRFDSASGSIASHAPNTGGAYTSLGAGATLGAPVGTASIGSTEGGFVNATAGANSNITVTVQFQRSLTDFYVTADLVSSAASNTLYRAFYYSAFGTTTIYLRKIVSNVVQGISSSSDITALDGNPHTLALQTEEIAGGIRARLFLDGTQRLTWDDTTSPISDARKGQVVGRDVRVLDLVAEDVAAGADTTPPVITGPTGAAGAASISINVAENVTACGTWTANEAVTWSITGTDAVRFSISSGGAVTFVAPPNFEGPVDSGANNVYNFNVVATDTATNASSQAVTLTVTDVNPETAPGAPGGAAGITPTAATVQISFGAAIDAVSYEARVREGAAAFGSWTPFAGTTATWAGVNLGSIYTMEVRGINGIGTGSATTITFRVQEGASQIDGSTFVAVLLSALNV
jgi:hypothetical protein